MTARQWILSLALCLTTVDAAFAQVQSGSISGAIRDEQGGILPGVTVTLAGNGPEQQFVTETDGQFRFLNVPPGTYNADGRPSGLPDRHP